MKPFLVTTFLFIMSAAACFAQEKAKERADSLAQLKDSQNNPYKNTLSWDFSNVLHSVNTYVYDYPNYSILFPNGASIGNTGSVIQSGFPASVYYRHRIAGTRRVRRDRFKYFRANLSLNYVSYNSPDSLLTHVATQAGTLAFTTPNFTNDHFAGSVSVGLEWAYHLGRFQLFYALDLVASYSSYHSFNGIYEAPNGIDYDYYSVNKSTAIGLSPCGGVNYYISQRLIIGIETAYIQYFTKLKNTIREVNESTAAETEYATPGYSATSGTFIPLRAIKVGFNF